MNFCTLGSKEYVIKILAMYSSLKEHSKSFHLYICCLDNTIYDIISSLSLGSVTAFPVENLESTELKKLKYSRSPSEYCWTLKPFLLEYIFDKYSVERAIYCDGDIFFYSNPEKLFRELDYNSVLLCPQRDLEWVHKIYGYYQAGVIGFKNSTYGRAALTWWRDKCFEWCYLKSEPENERFGDQKYLDKLPKYFEEVSICNDLGVDAAPWNSVYNNNYNIYTEDNKIYIQGHKLICFHFACVSIYNLEEFDLWTFEKLYFSNIMEEKIYKPYLKRLQRIGNFIKLYINHPLSSLYKSSSPQEAKSYFRLASSDSVDKISSLLDRSKEVSASPTIIKDFTKNKEVFQNKNKFCTIVSKEYVLRVLALYSSLERNANDFHLWICTLDDISFKILNRLSLKKVTIISSSALENQELLELKKKRSLTEYAWTLKPVLCMHLLVDIPLDNLIYCDADIYLFQDIGTLLKEWSGHSFFMCRQRYGYENEKVHGSFQAGLLGFTRDNSSLDILSWWKKSCIDWCYETADLVNNRWGDQKYLEMIPHLFSNIKLVDHIGINTAPWNLILNNNHKVSSNNKNIYIDNTELVIYHFGSMQIFNGQEFDLWKNETINFSEEIKNYIYKPYIKELQKYIRLLENKHPDKIRSLYSHESPDKSKNYYKHIIN